MTQDPVFNPFDPAQVDDQWDQLAALRDTDPAAQVMPGGYFVTRFADVSEIARDHRRFGQGGFTPLSTDERHPDLRNLGETDPPFHTWVRANLASALSAARVRGYEPLIRDICGAIVREFASRAETDAVTDLADAVPVQVMAVLIGMPDELVPAMRGYSDDVVIALARAGSPEADAAAARIADFDAGIFELVRARRSGAPARRPDDLLTALIACSDDSGAPISDQRIVTHLTKDVIVGGVETTAHAIGNLVYDLAHTEGAWQRLRADRSLVEAAVEESLRHLPPVQEVMRRAFDDTSIAGTAVPARSVVMLSLASAARDDTSCPHADTFDLDRPDRKNPAFSWGIHHCVGAALARAELRILLDELLDTVADIRVRGDGAYERVEFFMMQGPKSVPLRVVPAADD